MGWTGLLLYAYPGYMSFDSLAQLDQARSGALLDDHPPAMAVIWEYSEAIIKGPLGMLLLQTACLVGGLYLVFATRTTQRRAAILASLVLWFPPVANTMSVIWKDSQMAGYLVLGTGLLLSPRLRVRLGGLALIGLGTAMRHNALAMTFPLVTLLFYGREAHPWWKRYAIALVAWLAITLAASTTTSMLAQHHTFMWHRSLALLDMTGTLRYAEPIPDASLDATLAGTPLLIHDHYQEHARAHLDPNASPTDDLWNATGALFDRSAQPGVAQRSATSRAWRTIISAHPMAYLKYRLVVFAQLVQLDGTQLGSPIYCWFTDVQSPYESGVRVGHLVAPSHLQSTLQQAMIWTGSTWVFHVGFYLILAVLLLPLCWRDRESFAIVGSGLTGQLGLLVISPTVDVRYSFWLIFATSLGALLVALRRVKRRGSLQTRRSTHPGGTL